MPQGEFARTRLAVLRRSVLPAAARRRCRWLAADKLNVSGNGVGNHLPECRGASGSWTLTQSPPAARGGKGKASVVCVGNAFDDCQAQANAGVVGVGHAFAAPNKWFDKRGYELWAERGAGVFDGEDHIGGLSTGRDPHIALFRQVVNDRVVHQVRRQLQQERM